VLKLLATAGLLRAMTGPHGLDDVQQRDCLHRPGQAIPAVGGPLRGQVVEVGDRAGDGLDGRLLAVCDAAADMTRQALARVRLADLAAAE
jgi:hypothetical protein